MAEYEIHDLFVFIHNIFNKDNLFTLEDPNGDGEIIYLVWKIDGTRFTSIKKEDITKLMKYYETHDMHEEAEADIVATGHLEDNEE